LLFFQFPLCPHLFASTNNFLIAITSGREAASKSAAATSSSSTAIHTPAPPPPPPSDIIEIEDDIIADPDWEAEWAKLGTSPILPPAVLPPAFEVDEELADSLWGKKP
jgi:hypothetical protein